MKKGIKAGGIVFIGHASTSALIALLYITQKVSSINRSESPEFPKEIFIVTSPFVLLEKLIPYKGFEGPLGVILSSLLWGIIAALIINKFSTQKVLSTNNNRQDTTSRDDQCR